MTKRNEPFTQGGWYHCFNSGIDHRVTFEDTRDYQRFLEILYLANDQVPLRRNDVGLRNFDEIFSIPRMRAIVGIGAFCLMPGHFHLALEEIVPGGITTFMRKVGTAYTLYFNARYERSGNLFYKPFESIYTSTDHLPLLINYIHSNPTILSEPKWKTGHIVDYQFVEQHLAAYPYSSLRALYDVQAPIGAILAQNFLGRLDRMPVQKMLRDARLYCAMNDIP